MATYAALPAELALTALAGRFTAAELEIRALIAQAPTGDRAALLATALAILSKLRRDSAEGGAVGAVLYAYLVTAVATRLLTGRPSPDLLRAQQLGRGLALGLDRALVHAQESARTAFVTVTKDNIEDKAMDALTARVDAAGRRRQLAAEAAMRTQVAGAHAITRSTTAALDDGDQVTISSGGSHQCNMNAICPAFAGRTLTIGAPRTRLAPYHPHCRHRVIPAGVTEQEYVRAQEEAVATIS